jgi:membrane-bound lytic murein transglycosylase D
MKLIKSCSFALLISLAGAPLAAESAQNDETNLEIADATSEKDLLDLDQELFEQVLSEEELRSFSFFTFNYVGPNAEIELPRTQYIDSSIDSYEATYEQMPSIWPRIQKQFAMPNIQNKRVRQYEAWYRSNPEYVGRIYDRSKLYLHHIIEEVERRGIPGEIALLPMIESAFNPIAYSRAHAVGLWQFIPSTGKNYGLEQNWWEDRRRDVIASTNAALDYLQALHFEFQDWQLALAAYNMGENGLRRAIARNKKRGRSVAYSNLRIPRETRNYLPKLQAIKNIIESPNELESSLPHVADTPHFERITIHEHIDVAAAAQFADLSIEDFEMLNPSYNRPVITSDGNREILIPASRVETFNKNVVSQASSKLTWTTHKFAEGETLTDVAKKFNTTVDALQKINGLKPYVPIKIDQSILVPSRPNQTSNLNDTWDLPEFSQPSSTYGKRIVHKIKRGDTLSGIATKYDVSIEGIKYWNRIKGNTIIAGKTLVIYKDFSIPRVSQMLEQ